MKLKLLFRNILGNKKKTLICILGVCLSVMLIFVSVNAYVSFQNMRLENAYESYGEYNIILHNVDRKTSDWIRDELGSDAKIGIEKIYGITDTQITIVGGDANANSMNRYKLVSGSLPEKEGEVAISATAIKDDDYIINNYNIGDIISLDEKEYKISGIIEDYNYSTVSTYKIALVCDSSSADKYNVYLHCSNKDAYSTDLKRLKEYMGYNESNIFYGDRKTGFLNDYVFIVNLDLNEIEIEGEGSLADKNIGRLLICIIAILVFTSMVLGVHIFTSYLYGRNRQQGILKSLGFADKTVFLMYLLECFILMTAGCLAGIISGRFLTTALFDYVQSVRTVKLDNFSPSFTAQSYLLVIAISILSFVIGLIPILLRNLKYGINDSIKVRHKKYKADGEKYSNTSKKHATLRYFLKDSYPLEKTCIYVSMMIIGLGLMLLINVDKYVKHTTVSEGNYDVQFELLSDDVSQMGGLVKLIPEAAFFDIVYDTMGMFDIDKSKINNKYMDSLAYDDKGYVACEIVGVSKLQYERKIELSDEMSYEDFVDSGGVIVIDNYLNEGQTLSELPDIVQYAGRDEEGRLHFDAGEVKIIARSRFRNWNDQIGISFIVPDELFLKKFDYTNALIKINAKEGFEIELAKKLNKYAGMYKYTFWDHASQYIKEQDDHKTIKTCTVGIFIFITIMNLFIIVYTSFIVFVRRQRNISVLKILGHSDLSLMGPMVLGLLAECIVAAIVTVFISTLASKKLLPKATQDVILTGGLKSIIIVMIFMVITQTIAACVVFLRLRKLKVSDYRTRA